jgi:methyl-accepting chemotaxis protein
MENAKPRKIVFIDRKFQTAFILKFVLLLAVGTAVFLAAAYALLDKPLGDNLYQAHFAAKSTMERLLPTILALGAVFVLLLGGAMVVVTLYVSHHIAGPLYAIRRYLDNISRGELDFEPRLRDKDQTTPLAQALARAVETLNARLVAIRAGSDQVQAATAKLSAHLVADTGTDACRKDLAELLARSEALHRDIDFFHLRRAQPKG